MNDDGGAGTRQRIREGRCACCGGHTEDFELIAEADIRMCREWCINPDMGRDHRDPETIRVILAEAAGRSV